MPFNGSGSFSPPGADFPAVASTLIESSKFNNVINDIATGLSTCITKDGQTTVMANIPFGGFRLTGIGAATAATDAARVSQVQNGTFRLIGTVGGTANAITGVMTPTLTAYASGQLFVLVPTAVNTGATTLTIDGIAGGAKNVFAGGAACSGGELTTGVPVLLEYDGTQFQIIGPINRAWKTFAPTVTLVGGAGNTVPVYTNNLGRWMQVGKKVFVSVNLNGDGGAEGAGTGTFTVALPVAVGANATGASIAAGRVANNTNRWPAYVSPTAGATTVGVVIFVSITSIPALTGDDQNNATRSVSLDFSYEVD